MDMDTGDAPTANANATNSSFAVTKVRSRSSRSIVIISSSIPPSTLL